MRIEQEPARHGNISGSSFGNQDIAYPLNSKNRHMTLATTSSFLSNCPLGRFDLALVRAASFSDAVAPKHKTKSIVED